MNSNNIAIVSSRTLAKSGGIQTVTRTLFEGVFPMYFLGEDEDLEKKLEEHTTIVFSGFDETFVELNRTLRKKGKKIAIFWHFSAASEVDVDLGKAWRALVQMQKEGNFDLFITCKCGLDYTAAKLFKLPTFMIMNNAMENHYRDLSKEGIGIYSGSSDYWVKNLRPNLYAALMTGMHVDLTPYDDTIRSVVNDLGMGTLVTGTSGKLDHDDFLKRMASRELVSYVTFVEGAPILPLEALNNGVVCLTGDNHHYFREDKRLHDLLVVTRPDDPKAIYDAILKGIECKKEILDRYCNWKKGYDKRQQENFEQLFECLNALNNSKV